MRTILSLLILFLVSACSPKVRTQLLDTETNQPLSQESEVKVLTIEEKVPASAKKLGSVKVSDGGLTLKCDWETVLGNAKKEARNAGGNLIKITRHILPGIVSSCHQIDADIYYVNEIEIKTENKIDSLPDYEKELAKIPTEMPFQKYRIAFNGGFSYLVAKINSDVPIDFKQYTKELKSGYHFSFDGGYFWKENIGLGLKYSSFRTSNSINNIYVTDINGQTRYGKMSDNINTQFFGAILYNRGYSKSRKTIWFANASLGYIDYKNKGVLIDNYTITGGNIGASLDLGVDFNLGKNFYFGLGLGYTVGALNKYKITNGISEQTIKLDEENRESLNRIDISGGLRWAW